MRQLPDHPEIAWIERTGYPRRSRRPCLMDDDYEEEFDEDAAYEERRDADHGW